MPKPSPGGCHRCQRSCRSPGRSPPSHLVCASLTSPVSGSIRTRTGPSAIPEATTRSMTVLTDGSAARLGRRDGAGPAVGSGAVARHHQPPTTRAATATPASTADPSRSSAPASTAVTVRDPPLCRVLEQGGVEGQARAEGQHHHRRAGRCRPAPAVQDQQHGRRRAVAVLGQRRPGRRQRVGGQPQLLLAPRRGSAARPGAPPNRPRRSGVSPCRASRSSTSGRTCRDSTCGTCGDRPIRKPRSVTCQVMWSAVVVSVTAATSRTAYPRPPGTTTAAAAASENSACATICWVSTRAWTAGRAGWSAPRRAAPPAGRERRRSRATAPSPGSAA